MSDLPPPQQPYRGAAILHAVLGIVILVVAAVSGGSLAKALVVAVAYVVVATGWSWFRLRQRAEKAAGQPTGDPGRNGR